MGLTRPKYSNIVDTDYKASCRIVTTTNITLSGGAPSTYDSVTLASGDRVLVNAQSTGSQNGIYIVQTLGTGSNGTWIRATDASASAYVTAGMRTFVAEGTYAGTEYRLVTPDPITLGSTSISFQTTASTVSGANKSVQYNNSGFIAGATNLVYDNVTGNVTVAGTTATVSDSTGALVVKGGVGVAGNLFATGRLTVSGVSTFNSNVVIVGNLTTLGNTFITNSFDLSIQDSIINLHSPTDLTPLVTNDGLDIGLKLHYYDTVDSAAFLGRDNPTGYLVWEDKGSDVGGVFTSTSLGTFKVGNILLSGNTYRGTSTIGAAIPTYVNSYTTQSATPPASPYIGDQWYDTSTDTLYQWTTDGTSYYWVDKLSQPVAISFATQATVPVGPKQGDLWYDTSTDTLYTRVYDGSSNYWVDYSTAGVSTVAGLGALISNVSVGNITPYGNIIYNIGTTTAQWANIFTSNLIVSGGTTLNTLSASSATITQSGTGNQYALTMKGSGSGDQWAFTVGSTTGQNNITSLNSAGSAYAPFSINGSTFTVGTTGAGATTSLSIDNAGNVVITNANLTLGNVSTGAAKNGYNVARGTTFANIDNVSASVFANGVPAFSSVSGTMNYFWSAITNLTGGKFFGNTSTGGAVTTVPTFVGSVNGPLGSGGDTVTAILQDQDLQRVYKIIYMQTVTGSSCAIVTTRIM